MGLHRGRYFFLICMKTGRMHVCDGTEDHPVFVLAKCNDFICIMSGRLVESGASMVSAMCSREDLPFSGETVYNDDNKTKLFDPEVEEARFSAAAASSGKEENVPANKTRELENIQRRPKTKQQQQQKRRKRSRKRQSVAARSRRQVRQRNGNYNYGENGNGKEEEEEEEGEDGEEEENFKYVRSVEQALNLVATDILSHLLCSDTRTRIYKEGLEKRNAECTKKVFTYVKQRLNSRRLPELVRCYEKWLAEEKRKRLAPPLVISDDKISAWVSLIVKAWLSLATTPYMRRCKSRINKKHFTLGMLFWLQCGFYDEENGKTYIPKDRQLANLIPPSRDFPLYGYQERDMTTGRKIIRDAIYEAMAVSSLQPLCGT